jgi:hypothetical protein
MGETKMSEHKLPKSKQIMPVFVFARRGDIEKEGFTLAGRLFIKEQNEELLPTILEQLLEMRSGAGPYAVMTGWSGDGRPPNAVDTDDDEVMAAWAKDCLTIEVRISPHDDGLIHLDSETIRQLRTATN